MDKSKIKEIFIDAKNGKKSEEKPRHRSPSRAFYKLKNLATYSENKELFQNFYLVEESFFEIKGKRFSGALLDQAELIYSLLTPDNLKEVITAFFEAFGDDVEDDFFDNVRGALISKGITALEKSEDTKKDVAIIRALREFDFSPFVLGYSSAEQMLRSDPTGLYSALDRETKALYREKIRAFCKKRALDYEKGVEMLLSIAREKGCHIGELLTFKKAREGFLIIPVVFFILLTALFFIVAKGVLSTPVFIILILLSIFPLWQTAFEMSALIIARFSKSEILPRVDMPKIPKEHATLTLVTALVFSKKEIYSLFSRLEEISLKTKSRGKDEPYAFFGLLLDLPEKKNKATDDEIVRCAKKEVDRLNKKYENRFSLFIRDNEGEGDKRVLWERKRGAIIETVKCLSKEKSGIEYYGKVMPEIKYLVTLDSDTDMELGALNKMVGTMAHPQNRPKIEKKGGVKVVTSGFGVLQGSVCDKLESAHKTGFSTLISSGGGVDAYHSAIFNLNDVLFGKGLFSGKGMFDLEAFREVLICAFPENTVLSHDILEGSRMRTGYLPDVTFFDAIPSNARSYYDRAHRWARGDTQSLKFIKKRVESESAVVDNPMSRNDRFPFIQNFLNLCTPLSSLIGIFLLMTSVSDRAPLVALLFLLPTFLPLLREVVTVILKGPFSVLVRTFFTKNLTSLCREIVMLGWRLSSLAFVAFKNTDAIFRSIWRMTVSHEKLLEWTTANQSEKTKGTLSSYFLYTYPSFVLGVIFLAFSTIPLLRLVGILWCTFFLFCYFSSKPYITHSISSHRKKKLIRYARDIWRYFDKYADESNNFLPPDNVSVFPTSEVACRTSPTNIGLFLLSILSAVDLSFISIKEGVTRIERAMSSIEKLPKFKGHLYNWYSTVTLEIIGQEYISTVDSGNFVASLVTLFEGLREYEREDARIKKLLSRIKAIEENTDFRFLFDQKKNLFSLGYFPDREMLEKIGYDMYMSEARITDYYAVARGIVRDSHWYALSRPLIVTNSGVGSLSWSGTAFEYFMPHLFLPIVKNSFCDEALNFAFSKQLKFSKKVQGERIFGVSESGYFAFDENLSYQYRAFGVPSLSRRVENESQRVYSPYSSFLMLPVSESAVIKNLEAFERLGMYGECGFFEAIDLVSGVSGKSANIVKSFMAHHLGMSLIAISNAVLNNVFQRRFMADAEMRAVREILTEAVPANAPKARHARIERPEKIGRHLQKKRYKKEEKTFTTAPEMSVLSGRGLSATVFERGIWSLSITSPKGDSTEISRPVSTTSPVSLFMYSSVSGRVSSPSYSKDTSFALDPSFCQFKQGDLLATLSLSARNKAVRIRLEATGEAGEVGIYFEPVLNTSTAFLSHPAFSSLFIKSEYDRENNALIISRVGEKSVFLAILSSSPYEFETSRLKLFSGGEFGLSELLKLPEKETTSPTTSTPLSPCAFLRCKFKTRTDTTFVIGVGRGRAEAVQNAKEELETPLARSTRLSRELFYSALSASGFEEMPDKKLCDTLLNSIRFQNALYEKGSLSTIFSKEALYSFGISGDLPIFVVKKDTDRKALLEIIKCHKLHYITGARYDLIIEIEDEGYMRGGRGEILSLIESVSASFLISRKGGIFLVDRESARLKGLDFSKIYPSFPSEVKKQKFPATLSPEKNISLPKEPLREGIERERYIINKEEFSPSVNHSHVIASSTFGTIINQNSLGFTWAKNSRMARITHFENDSVGGEFSEKIIVRCEGAERDLLRDAGEVVYSAGVGEYRSDNYSVRVAIHPTLMFKAVSVKVPNTPLEILYKFTPVLDDFQKPSARVEFVKEGTNAYLFTNPFSSSFEKGFGYLLLPFEKEIKREENAILTTSHKEGEVLFVLGYAGSEAHFKKVSEYFKDNSFDDLATLSRESVMKYIRVAERRIDKPTLTDFWLPYQVLVSRFFARSGPYQSGGAWGFRDQAQDCLTVMDMSPSLVRAHIVRMASHQYIEGDVQHWWHPQRRGVRTRCSDDYLWLIWLVCVYLLRTGDKSILDIKTHYLISKPLSKNEHERYEVPEKSEERESILCHLKKALDLMVSRPLGSHGLMQMGNGDWNDGMNMLPDGSESVWLSFFARCTIKLYSTATGDNSYDDFSLTLRDNIEKHAFFSDRYARAFFADGTPLGVEGSPYFEIDALPQAFASICHFLTGDMDERRITLALDTSFKELYCQKAGIFKLFSPPLKAFSENIGYLSRYPEGLRENAGQYTHASVWAGLGFLVAPKKKEENLKRAKTLIEALDPTTHKKEIYQTERYVLSGDVYSNPEHLGRGGWSWYTGSASWYRHLILNTFDKKRNKSTPFS